MYSSLAVVVVAGLTTGTIITLILLPIFIHLFFKIKNFANKYLQMKKKNNHPCNSGTYAFWE